MINLIQKEMRKNETQAPVVERRRRSKKTVAAGASDLVKANPILSSLLSKR